MPNEPVHGKEVYTEFFINDPHKEYPVVNWDNPVGEDGFPRLTVGNHSGAVFLMVTDKFGYSITDGANCFLPLGNMVYSMSGMLPYTDDKYDEHLALALETYRNVLIHKGIISSPEPATEKLTAAMV